MSYHAELDALRASVEDLSNFESLYLLSFLETVKSKTSKSAYDAPNTITFTKKEYNRCMAIIGPLGMAYYLALFNQRTNWRLNVSERKKIDIGIFRR